MKRLLSWLLLTSVILTGLGFYRGWFTLSSGPVANSNKVDLRLTVDADKVRDDAKQVQDKARSL